MPELPEVEITRRGLIECSIVQKVIEDVYVSCPRTVGSSVQAFKETLIGSMITGLSRKGKHLIFHLDTGLYIAVHLRMSGRFCIRHGPIKMEKHDRVAMLFPDSVGLYFQDARKFGRVLILENLRYHLSSLGIDPFSEAFTLDLFCRLYTSSRPIKTLLLDQKIVCGIGNIYADEALFIAKIHPLVLGKNLTTNDKTRLFYAILKVLQDGIERGGTSLGHGISNFHSVNGQVGENVEYLYVYGRRGLPCRFCKCSLEKIVIAQRSSHYCSSCQNR